MTTIAAAEYTCAVCGNVAGRVEVVPSPTGSGSRLVHSVFFSMWRQGPPESTYAEAAQALRGGDPRALWALDREWAPFYCPECNACYCRDHWRQWMEFDEGFYDCTYGTCPQGHTRMLDD
ncbi:MAG TPA: hypothetical protein VFJ82_22585 [Longimicrobium sp.]|nr:hypothetical protein [Longimicrobium sp.]